jgi:hypothetical protein
MMVRPRSTSPKLTPSGFEGVPPSVGWIGREDRQMVGKTRPEVKETGADAKKSLPAAGVTVCARLLPGEDRWRLAGH